MDAVCSTITDGTHKTPRYVESGVPFISIANIKPFSPVDWDSYRRFITIEEHLELTKRCKPELDDVLISRIGTLGVAKRVDWNEEFSIFVGLGLLKPIKEILFPSYLEAWMNTQMAKKIATEQATGSGRLTLSLNATRSFPFPLAPLCEQRRIVAKLDALFEKSRSIREKLDRLPRLLANLQKSILNSAFRGDLTKEWRANNGVAEPWRRVALSDVATDFSYGSSAKSEKLGLVPVLRMGNIQGGRLDWSDLAFSSDASEIEKYRLRSGDVLFNRTNSPELVGKTAVFDDDRDAIYAGYLIRIRCGEQLNPKFLAFQLNGPAGRDYCWRVKSDGVSQSNINAKKIAAFEFDLPPRVEQDEIVRQLEAIFERIRSLKILHLSSIEKTSQLESASLGKAFRGELVPQDPSDEPASVLLERIRTLKPAAGAKRVRGRKEGCRVGDRAEVENLSPEPATRGPKNAPEAIF